jgi:serine/threonine protein kinase
MSFAEPFLGQVIEGKYRLEAKIGAGGFGVVYRATHLGLGQAVAVKALNAGLADSAPETVARFQQEAASAFRLNHPNSVTIYDFGVTGDGMPYLAMELLEGAPLSYALHRNGPMTPARCAEILLPVCAALAEAHAEGLVHRDIKPDNIFLSRTKRGEVVKVLDFGIAKLIDRAATNGRDGLTASGGLIGTPAYMSPERLKNEPYDGRADVYSLGVMLYQMLAGKTPFRATDGSNIAAVLLMHVNDPPPRLADAGVVVPPAVEDVVLRALEKDQNLRPTVAEFACALAEAVGIETPSFSEASGVTPPRPEISALLALSAEAPTQIHAAAPPLKATTAGTDSFPPSSARPETIPGTERISANFTTPESVPRATRRDEAAPPSRRLRAYVATGGAMLLLGGGLWGGWRLGSNAPSANPEGLRNTVSPAPQSVSAPAEPPPPAASRPAPPRKKETPPAPPLVHGAGDLPPAGAPNFGDPPSGTPDWDAPPPSDAPPAVWRRWRQRQMRKYLRERRAVVDDARRLNPRSD